MSEGRKPILVLDFDGVVHSYTSGWEQHNIISDPPVPGAFEFIDRALKHFRVAIFSSRSSKTMGVDAMRKWFTDHGLPGVTLVQLDFPVEKPPAFVTIDDRALTFTGKWPALEDLLSFKTWMQSERPVLHPSAVEEVLIAIARLRDRRGKHIDIHPRSVLQQWVLDQVPESLR